MIANDEKELSERKKKKFCVWKIFVRANNHHSPFQFSQSLNPERRK
jgi:hypothetical protein